jgi:NADH-quinone oxidoreductase subunit L
MLLMLASLGVAATGVGVAYHYYMRRPAARARLGARFPGWQRVLTHAYYVDALYDAVVVRPLARLAAFAARVVDPGIIDGAVNGAASLTMTVGDLWRRMQTGNVQHYALSLLLGAVAIVVYYTVG